MTTKANLVKLAQVHKANCGWITIGALRECWNLDNYFDRFGESLESKNKTEAVYFEGQNESYFVIEFEMEDGEQLNFGIMEDGVKFKKYGDTQVITKLV